MSNKFFPVSFAQQRLLFLDQLNPGTSAYNLTRAIRMVGPLDPGALTKTLKPLRNAARKRAFVSGLPAARYPITGTPGCCARAASGHAAAALPSVAKNFRRPMWLAM